jgi:hypothetical protein
MRRISSCTRTGAVGSSNRASARVSAHGFAATFAALGDRDKAFEWLDRSLDARFGPMIYLKVNPIWDPLRADPRFADRLRRVGLQP